MTACTHSTVIEDARKFRAQKKQCHKPYIVASNDHYDEISQPPHVGKRRGKSLVRLNKLDMSNYIYSTRGH